MRRGDTERVLFIPLNFEQYFIIQRAKTKTVPDHYAIFYIVKRPIPPTMRSIAV